MGLAGAIALRDGASVLPRGFWAAVSVWLEKPQVVNKRLSGSRIEAERRVSAPAGAGQGRGVTGGAGEGTGAAERRTGDGERGTGAQKGMGRTGDGERETGTQEGRGRTGDGGKGTGAQEGTGMTGDGERGTGAQEGKGRTGDGGKGTGAQEGKGRTGDGERGTGAQEGKGRTGKREKGTGTEEERGMTGDGGKGTGAEEGREIAGNWGQGREEERQVIAGVGAIPPLTMLEAVWSDFSGMIAQEDCEMPAFIKELGKENQPETDALNLNAVLRTLFPKSHPHCSTAPRKEMVIKDTFNGTVTFLPLEENDEGKYQVKKCNIYQIRLRHTKDDEWSMSILTSSPENWVTDGIVYPKRTWLGKELLSKLAKWSTEEKQSEFKSTLSLISVAKYSKVYQALKKKYKEMVKVWPEVTDPEKFVYEDVAIATYLLILWEEERAEKGLSKKQSFVDLGCGNGLLVHILSNEGYPGRGIDVRRRKIWNMYGPQTHLEECAIRPDDSYLFPNVDWLIGNHSDELTPWIPVIAARSSYSCCYFVLPCCFFDFHGKYNRRQSQKTQYREYLDFVTEVGLECGFRVEEDCLRIPSTKRVCLIGKSRTYPPLQEDRIDKQRTQYINNHQSCTGVTSDKTVGSNQCDNHHVVNCVVDQAVELECAANETKTDGDRVWLSGFQPREKVEQVRNCAALPRDFVDDVVLTVASLLLKATQEKPWDHTLDVRLNTWNKGESLSLREVAEHLDKETLKRLKNEYGGLQTLLRNNHQVFEVLNGRVHIRDWREEKPLKRTKPEVKRRFSAEAFKTRLCWFFIHHPDGCSLTSESCPYAHGTEELRQSQIMKKKKHP